MGIETALLIGSLAAAAAGTVTQAQAAKGTARAAGAAAQLEADEAARQAGVANIQAAEQSSDRVRQANREFSSALAGLAETGAIGGITASRFATQIGTEEGIDLARIESNRQDATAAFLSGADAASQRARNAQSIARSQTTGAILGGVGSGLQIGARAQSSAQLKERERDRV